MSDILGSSTCLSSIFYDSPSSVFPNANGNLMFSRVLASRHILHQLQFVEVGAGQANDEISTLKRQGFSPQFWEAGTVHGPKQGFEWQRPEEWQNQRKKKCRPGLLPSRHISHQLQLVEVDAGQASDVITTLERKGFSPQFMKAETLHGSK